MEKHMKSFFLEKAKGPLSNDYSISSDVSRFHSVSRIFIYQPMYIYNGQKIFWAHYQPIIYYSESIVCSQTYSFVFIYYIFELVIFESQLPIIWLL